MQGRLVVLDRQQIVGPGLGDGPGDGPGDGRIAGDGVDRDQGDARLGTPR